MEERKTMRKVTSRKWMGDDAGSWAVFVEGQDEPVVSGLTRREVPYEIRRVKEILAERERDAT